MPPILDDVDELLRGYITDPQIPIHKPDLFVLPRSAHIERLYQAPGGIAGTTLSVRRDPRTNAIVGYDETIVPDAESNATNSLSMRRAAGPPETATRGSAVNYPFWPGGFEEPATAADADTARALLDETVDFVNDLLCDAPGFPYGVDFEAPQYKKQAANGDGEFAAQVDRRADDNLSVNLLSLAEEENNVLGLWREEEVKPDDAAVNSNTNVLNPMPSANAPDADDEYEHLFDTPPSASAAADDDGVLKISDTQRNRTLEWAEMLSDSKPVLDFHLRVPNPAYRYPFELDIFQKQAIMKLEEHSHVFVAAHTSAGKTVVAEYAIALSKQHLTRTIYTSPIKALSNQKYHDFKAVFGDVGLITGDIQIDPTASCLIMTTEILRSMLYCGSEVTRDLEYVIFDEVHYITDPDRGYVWEEVLILLPDHVSIVMLSATVPNTLEFANWVGQTKKRKVYVCSTLRRPIPLVHHLYTGSGGKTKNDIFELVNGGGDFSVAGYRAAVAAKEHDRAPSSAGGGAATNAHKPHRPHPQRMSVKQEQNMLIGLIDHLRRNDKLPVVCFTLSRNRCDRNLQALQSVDLCTAKESGFNYYFVQKCVQQLKPEDRALPQVLTLQDSLRRGIGVHHSGILPILKEIVEILFQKGHVKLLFATETFAMGVNMPARTVVFDSMRKFDGTESRMLRPAEYTQMAGRAGRRGKDAIGTVIMLCKDGVPPEADLRTMILGRPMQLESQFRLTYAMILNLLRVESVTVEDMMSHSFMEFDAQTRVPGYKEKLKEIERELSGLQELGAHMRPLVTFYQLAEEYVRLNEAYMVGFIEISSYFATLHLSLTLSLQKSFIAQGQIAKELRPGRILIVTHQRHYNKLAILLQIHSNTREPTFSVLVLDDQQPQTDADSGSSSATGIDDPLWHRMIALSARHQHYRPEGIGGHRVLVIRSGDIVDVTRTVLRCEPDRILQNWQQRQIPRFQGTPAGATVVQAVNELSNLSAAVAAGREQLASVEHKRLDLDMQTQWQRVQLVHGRLLEGRACTTASNFEQEFVVVYERKKLEQRRDQLMFYVSKESYALYPDYLNKLDVLRTLQYIDAQDAVTMKGRVACEMGSNELIITELVLCNTFTDLEPDEIPALLSGLVFQAKTDEKPKLTPNLEKVHNLVK